jgi:hypothetical protein
LGAGIYSSASLTNGLSLGTNSGPVKFFADSITNERMRIDSSGNVGIGIANPSYKLVVSNAGNAGFEFDPTLGTPLLQCYDRTASAYKPMQIWAQQLQFNTGTSPAERVRIDSTGALIAKPAAGTGAVFNEDGVDADFRVESDTNTHALFVQGSDGNVLMGTTTNTNSSKLVVDGTISETVSSTQYLVASQYDIGTAPNEIPLNGYLGSMAYQDTAPVAAPASTSAAGLPGQIAYDSSYFYVCTAVNTWKRVAIATW